MKEKQLAENIMKTVGSSLLNKDDVTLSGLTISERYHEMLFKAGHDPRQIEIGKQAIRHYVICAAYVEGKFEYHISNHKL